MVLAFPNTYRLAQGMILELLSQDEEAAANAIDAISAENRDGLRPPKNPNSTTPFTSGVTGFNPGRSALFQYFNVYPLSVAGTTVGWAMMDEMMEVTVTFSFTHWQQVV